MKPLHIRVITHDELTNNAESAYRKFLAANQDCQKLDYLFDSIRDYQLTDQEENTLHGRKRLDQR